MALDFETPCMDRRAFAKTLAAGCAVASLGGVLSACSSESSEEGQSAAEDGENQVIVVMGPGSEPAAGFDPFVSWGCGEHVHEPLIQSTLIATDENLEFVNDLAVDYSCEPDGLTWHFEIRPDVKFTDGEPLTAHDVAFTINGIKASAAAEADLSMVDEAVALDDIHVDIKMAKPYNALLYTLAVVGIVPEHAYGEGYGAAPIGSGRYMLEQWDKGQQVILKANPDYYGEAPLMERVVVAFMEEDAALAAAQSAQVDVAYTSAVLAFASQQADGYGIMGCASVDSRGISLPCIPAGGTKMDGENEYAAGSNVTCDVAVRQAINLAVDRQVMLDAVLSGYGTPAYSVCDSAPWGSPDMQVQTDVAAAKKLLDEAGWKPGEDDVRVKDGVRAAFDLYYSAGDSVRQALAAEFTNQMAAVGIEVTVKGASWDEIYPNEFSSPVLWGWGSNTPTELYQLNHSKGWGNYACYESEMVDSYLDEALAVPHIEDSYELFQKAQWDGEEGIAPQGAATWCWLVNVDHLYFVREGLEVAKQKPHPHGHGWSLLNNVDRWTWAK